MAAFLLSAFTTLLVVVDPIGLAPIFVSLARGLDHAHRRRIAWEACVIAFGLLAGSALFGDWLLALLGISLTAFRIAGGLLLFAIAFEMVFQRRNDRKAAQVEYDKGDIAAFPLAIPLMAGPGAITAMILLAGQLRQDWFSLAGLILVMGVVMLGCYLTFLSATRLERFLSEQGEMVLSRLLGVLLAALAVQYVADGIKALAG